MSRIKRICNWHTQIKSFLHFERLAANLMLERLPFEQFHSDEGPAAFLANVMNGADIRMIEGRRRLGLAAETFQGLRIPRKLVGKKLKRDEAIEAHVLGPIHHAHPSATKHFHDSVVRNGAANERIGFGHGAIS
jgi:hypothetical protein